MRTSRLSPVLAFLILGLWSLSPAFAQRRPSADPFPDDDQLGGSTHGRSFSVGGTVVDSQTGARLDGVRIDLQSFTAGNVTTAFTSSTGAFQFNDVREGTYDLVFDQIGYQELRQQLDVNGPVFAINVTMRKLNQGAPGGPTVSVRELSIPQKAREAMTKGMALLYQKSDASGSIKEFERAIKAYPDYYEAYAQIGVAYIHLKDNAHAEESLRQSISVSKEQYSDAYFMLAALFSSQDRFSDAEPLAQKSVELDPKSWHAQAELAQALVGLQRAEDAEPHAQAAVDLQPDNPLLRLSLANVHIALENDTALLEDLKAYLKLAPNGPFADKVRQQRDQVQQRLQKSDAAPTPAPDAAPATAHAANP
jgi:Tfp pilus assembly protein PilF